MRLIGDIETNGLLDTVSKLHCIVTKDVDTGIITAATDLKGYQPEREGVVVVPLDAGLEMVSKAGTPIFHNGIGYDFPALEKLRPGFTFNREGVVDTLIESRLIWPRDALKQRDFPRFKQGRLPGNLIGSHSLEAFGYRLGLMKGDYSDWCKEQGIDPWSECRPEMVDYCVQDVVVTAALFERCQREPYHPAASRVEHATAFHIAQMERNGFPFDEPAAAKLYSLVCAERDQLGQELRSLFPPWYAADTGKDDAGNKKPKLVTPKKDRLMGAQPATIRVNGKLRKVRIGGVQYTAGASYTPVELREFNPNSRSHIADRLMKVRGWVPTEFTEAGAPIVDETTLSGLPYPEAKPLTRFLLLQKRAGQIGEGDEAWLKVSRNGVIYGRVNTLGAVTRRMSHSKPNIAQVPKVGSYFGSDCRALFWAGAGWTLVGADLAGIELRMLAHYMARYDGGAYARAVCEGKSEDGTDVHSLNAVALGLDPKALYVVLGKQVKGRDIAKTFIYAFLYGAGAAKLASILGRPESEGASLKKRFLKGLPALKALIDAVGEAVKSKGHLIGLDGGRIPVRSAHSALNSLLQSAGAIVAKWWLVAAFEMYAERGWKTGVDFVLRAMVHDEAQASARPELAQEFGEITVAAIAVAGERLKCRVPLTGEFKLGRTWKDTH